MKELVFATNNQHKLEEIISILGKDFKILSLNDIGLKGDIAETESTLQGNASLKARFIYQKTGKNCFADDTGLEVDALNGEPGVFSARYAGPENNAAKNTEKLLLKLKNSSNRKAQFRTVIALIIEGKEYFFEGIVRGEIAREKKGTQGFGYDPVFIPEGHNISFAEMPLEQKNQISHRAMATNKLAGFLLKS